MVYAVVSNYGTSREPVNSLLNFLNTRKITR